MQALAWKIRNPQRSPGLLQQNLETPSASVHLPYTPNVCSLGMAFSACMLPAWSLSPGSHFNTAAASPAESTVCRLSWGWTPTPYLWRAFVGYPPFELSKKAPALLFLALWMGVDGNTRASCWASSLPSLLGNDKVLDFQLLTGSPRATQVLCPHSQMSQPEPIAAQGCGVRAYLHRGSGGWGRPLSLSHGPVLQLGLCNLTL